MKDKQIKNMKLHTKLMKKIGMERAIEINEIIELTPRDEVSNDDYMNLLVQNIDQI